MHWWSRPRYEARDSAHFSKQIKAVWTVEVQRHKTVEQRDIHKATRNERAQDAKVAAGEDHYDSY